VDPQELLRPWFESALEAVDGVELFDIHTHTGSNDPDGYTFTREQLEEMLERAGARAAFFTMHEPDGYREANDRVLREAAEANGRLVPFCRVNPHDDAPGEARRAIDAGARGIKLHPRAEGFTLDHPAAAELFAISEDLGVPIIIHAGRGIPALGKHVVQHLGRHPGARAILAHAGICDLAWIWRAAERHPNLFFDTAWWNPADLIAMFRLVPPGQLLYGSDAPYGRPLISVPLAMRCALQAGLSDEQIRSIMGGQAVRLLGGEELLDLGRPPGGDSLEVDVLLERVASYLVYAVGPAFAGIGQLTEEAVALARLSCEVTDEAPQAPVCRSVLALLEELDRIGGPREAKRGRPHVAFIILALCLARTPAAPLPRDPEPVDVSERVS
jgi:predicted TIM-barrel fold metal-dependent hydrolase